MSRVNLSTPRHALAVVTHHKSGTVLGMNVIVSMCCPEVQAHSNHGYFWSAWLRCRARCAASLTKPTTRFYANGLPIGALASLQHRAKSLTVLHFVRSPVDMIVSGYLYHRSCAEPRWTNSSRMTGMWSGVAGSVQWFGDAVTARQVRKQLHGDGQQWSYCTLLQHASPAQGLTAEATRSFGASDGVAKMVADDRLLQQWSTGSSGAGGVVAHRLCMNHLRMETESGRGRWAELGVLAGVPMLRLQPAWAAEHGTASRADGVEGVSRRELMRLARPLVREHLQAHGMGWQLELQRCQFASTVECSCTDEEQDALVL